MKKIISSAVIVVLFFAQNIFTQGWQWIDTGFPVIIFDMSFPSGQSDIGFAVGSNLTFGGDGIILKTTNGGSTWTKISTDTIPGLKAVSFTSVDIGCAGGGNWLDWFQGFVCRFWNGLYWLLIGNILRGVGSRGSGEVQGRSFQFVLYALNVQ